MNNENLIPQIVEKCNRLERQLRINRYILYFISGIVVGELIPNII